MRHHQRLQADDLLTNKEVERLVDACNSFRDKTLVMLLYGTGCRIGELLSARLKDIIDHHGQTALRVKGKTGEHYYYIAYAALPYLNQYLASLSTADPEDRLFPLAYRSIHGLLARAANRAGINKRVYPHLFRHMRNTYLIKKVGKDKAKMIMGYASTSSEIDNYLHLIEQDTTAAFLESEGHPTEEQVTLDPEIQLPEPVECPRCHFVNIVGSNFCARCTLPFHGDVAEEETMAEKMERLENTVQTLMNVIARKMGVE